MTLHDRLTGKSDSTKNRHSQKLRPGRTGPRKGRAPPLGCGEKWPWMGARGAVNRWQIRRTVSDLAPHPRPQQRLLDARTKRAFLDTLPAT